MTSVAATSVRAAAVPVVRAVRARSATVRGRLAIVPTARRVGPARMVIVLMAIARKATALRVTAPKVIGRVRKASGSGRVAISATGRRVIAPRATVRVPSAIVRMARRAVTVLMVIARTAIVPASSAPRVIVPRAIVPRVTVRARSAIVRTARRVVTGRKAIVPARTAAPVASAAGVAPLS